MHGVFILVLVLAVSWTQAHTAYCIITMILYSLGGAFWQLPYIQHIKHWVLNIICTQHLHAYIHMTKFTMEKIISWITCKDVGHELQDTLIKTKGCMHKDNHWVLTHLHALLYKTYACHIWQNYNGKYPGDNIQECWSYAWAVRHTDKLKAACIKS